jgi:hypothetical protein
MQNPFFIVGAQRSGSTLLRLILNAHSEIAIPEEARFLMPLLKESYLHYSFSGESLKALIDYLVLNPQFKLWNYDTTRLFEQLSQMDRLTVRELIDCMYTSYSMSENKSRWGDKSLFFRSIDVLYAMFPGARFIHIVRDGRDVFHSWRKIDPSKDNVAVTALDWCYKLYRIERSFERLPQENRMTVRYEDLLGQPQATIHSICSFVGVDYEQAMLSFYRRSHNYVGAHHSELIFQPLDARNCYKWKKNLTQREIRVYSLLARRPLARYGYETAYIPIGFRDILSAVLGLALGLPQKVMQIRKIEKVLDKAVSEGRDFEQSLFHILPIGDPPKGSSANATTGKAEDSSLLSER